MSANANAMYYIFAIKDEALDAFLAPFSSPSIGVACRHFSDEINNPDSPMFKHPEDYSLWHLCTVSQVSGVLSGLTADGESLPVRYVKGAAAKTS